MARNGGAELSRHPVVLAPKCSHPNAGAQMSCTRNTLSQKRTNFVFAYNLHICQLIYNFWQTYTIRNLRQSGRIINSPYAVCVAVLLL